MSDEPLFMALDDDAPEVRATVAAARASLGLLREFCELPNALDLNPCVKLLVADGDAAANLWLRVVGLDGADFVGQFFELPPEFVSYTTDDLVPVAEADVLDWMVNDGGDLHGGYSLRLQRATLPPEERAGYDEYVGVRRYV